VAEWVADGVAEWVADGVAEWVADGALGLAEADALWPPGLAVALSASAVSWTADLLYFTETAAVLGRTEHGLTVGVPAGVDPATTMPAVPDESTDSAPNRANA
jgi:hypothetical protein